jgi:hypothetical protein
LATFQLIFKPKDQISWHLDLGLLMVAKASRKSASLPICQIPQRQTFFCFREAKPKPADLSLSQGAHDELEGGGPNQQQKTSPPLPFGSAWTAANNTSESALRRPKKVLKWLTF